MGAEKKKRGEVDPLRTPSQERGPGVAPLLTRTDLRGRRGLGAAQGTEMAIGLKRKDPGADQGTEMAIDLKRKGPGAAQGTEMTIGMKGKDPGATQETGMTRREIGSQ